MEKASGCREMMGGKQTITGKDVRFVGLWFADAIGRRRRLRGRRSEGQSHSLAGPGRTADGWRDFRTLQAGPARRSKRRVGGSRARHRAGEGAGARSSQPPARSGRDRRDAGAAGRKAPATGRAQGGCGATTVPIHDGAAASISPSRRPLTAEDEFFEFLFSGSDVKYAELKQLAAKQEPLPRFALKGVKCRPQRRCRLQRGQHAAHPQRRRHRRGIDAR